MLSYVAESLVLVPLEFEALQPVDNVHLLWPAAPPILELDHTPAGLAMQLGKQ